MTDATMTKADLVEEVIKGTRLPRKESEEIVETVFDSIISGPPDRRQDRDSRLRQFPHAPSPRPHRPQPKDRRKSGRAAQEGIPYFKPSKELKDYVNTPGAGQGARRRGSGNASAELAISHGSHLDALALSLYRTQKAPRPKGLRLLHAAAARKDAEAHIVLRGE